MSEKEVRSLCSKANRSLASARRLLEAGDHDFAVSRAYYAMFYAAKAALLLGNVKRSKHAAVIAAFGEHLVKTGSFTAEHHRILRAAFDDRGEADYADMFPPREEVETRLSEARQFLDAVSAFVRRKGIDLGA